jgi:NADH-quinone oxidoreductase subunit H
MRFGWKFLIPVTLAWVVVVAFIRASQLGFVTGPTFTVGSREYPVLSFAFVIVVAAAVLLAYWFWDNGRIERQAARTAPPPEEIDPFAGGFPVPPLPGQRLREPSLALGDRADRTDRATDKEAARG